MTDFNHILNWKLKSGSHDFPGPDGGTCINEAAIVAAGFEYKSVKSAGDCPPCFSQPISTFAIHLNDQMPDLIRNDLLLPFVTRLSGTADTPEIEAKRTEYIILQIARRMIAKCLVGILFDGFANAQSLEDVRNAAYALARDACGCAWRRSFALALDLDFALYLDFTLAIDLAIDLGCQLDLAFYKDAVAILDEAILMGNHPDQIEQGLVIDRMNKVKELA